MVGIFYHVGTEERLSASGQLMLLPGSGDYSEQSMNDVLYREAD